MIMSFEQYLRRGLILGGAALGLAAFVPSARANVYATNIKLNGSLTNAISGPGNSVQISYILNEPASSGVTINILNGPNVVRTISIPGNGFGTARGVNTITWDGTDNHTNVVGVGTYKVSITAASSGYTNWTQLTGDVAQFPYVYVFEGYGIAVDRNRTSPYYGRVYVVNAKDGNNPAQIPGDRMSVLKLNADASAADEGITSFGDFPWTTNSAGPCKVVVSDDDYVYVSTFIIDSSNPVGVYRWDPTLSSGSQLYVLRGDNNPSASRYARPFIQGSGTNTQIWMAGNNRGVMRWTVGANGACGSNDLGMTVVSGTIPFADAALDSRGNIYTCQATVIPGDICQAFRFPAYDPSTNGGSPESVATWSVGANDNTYGDARGIAVDPTGAYVAVSFESTLSDMNGNTKILSVATGALVTNLDLGVVMQGTSQHEDMDCAWDAVGNVYYIDEWNNCWRAVSPPGANQATTVAPATLQIAVLTPPRITGITVAGGYATITFTGMTGDSANAYTVLSAPEVTGLYFPAGATLSRISDGVFQASVPVDQPAQFYRIQR
jgi:hypothetical protein